MPPKEDNDKITSNTIIRFVMLALWGLVALGLGVVYNNTSDIPVIKTQQTQQSKDLDAIQVQIVAVPVIKVQMEYLTKQLERMNASEDSSSRQIETNSNKIADLDRRILTLETTRHK